MNAVRIRPMPVRRVRPTRNRITIAQFRTLMQALRELPPDNWRDEIPAHPLPAAMVPADPSYFPF